MFECHVRFERIFASKILTWAVAVTSLPGLLACRPWQAASGLVWKRHRSDCWEPSSTPQGTRTSPCFSATIFVKIRGFFQGKFYCLGICTKMQTRFYHQLEGSGFQSVKTRLSKQFSLKTLLRPGSAEISFLCSLPFTVFSQFRAM